MSEVKRHVTWFPSEIGGDMLENVVRASDYDDAQSELAALREELDEKGWDEMVTKLEDQNVELRQRLADAEWRNAELVGLLLELRNTAYTKGGISLAAYIDPHIKPTESGASENAN